MEEKKRNAAALKKRKRDRKLAINLHLPVLLALYAMKGNMGRQMEVEIPLKPPSRLGHFVTCRQVSPRRRKWCLKT